MIRKRSEQERIEKFGTADAKEYVQLEMYKGQQFADELFNKYRWLRNPWVKRALAFALIFIVITVIILLVQLVRWMI